MERKVNNAKESTLKVSKAAVEQFPVVGIGASAGGLEAFDSLFQNMPSDTGMAFILIQHIEPSHVGNMVELIQKYTTMPIVEVKEKIKIEPDHIYMIPQNRATSVTGRTLKLSRPNTIAAGHSIDPFFRSLATDLKEKAICIILSGTGTDGTIGARAVKAEGGLVVVQATNDARYDGMPRSVIDAGLADFILPAKDIGEKLMEYVQVYYGESARRRRKALESSESALKQIFAIMHSRVKRDFSGYKVSTINRRIERRMSLNKIDRIEDYIRLLQQSKDEVNALMNDFLIQVTSFFRDPEAFTELKIYLKALIEKKDLDEGIRAWVAGCSTGEEAYSIAILIQECMDELNRGADFQVFATDLDANGIEYARTGVYPESIVSDVSKDYLVKYFVKKDNHYQIHKELRERVVFAVHDLINDAPFSHIDLATARNLLIYLDSATQKKVIPLLHYALNGGGILFLGTAETVGDFTNLFSALDRKWKIYQAQKKETQLSPEIALNYPREETLTSTFSTPAKVTREDFEAERALLKALPPAVLIDNNLRILFVHGKTGKYLQFKEGKPSHNLIDMAREDIRVPLNTAIYQSISQHKEVVREDIPLKVNSHSIRIRITVRPDNADHPQQLIILFEDLPEAKSKRSKKGSQTELDEHNKALEQELQFARENLKSTVEELETANEELRSTLEEYQSTNEELHSTNEELETSKEELQSVNEELSTINNEYQKKIEELSTVNDDMKNLLNSTNVATVFLDEGKIIKRFTPTATKILNLMERDIGRPFKDITSILQSDGLNQYIDKVLEDLIPLEEEIRTRDNKWFSMRVFPYRTTQNAIAGVVVSFIDISRQKEFQFNLQKCQSKVDGILDTIPDPVLVLDRDLKVNIANPAFYQVFQMNPEHTEGKVVFDLNNGQWNLPPLERFLQDFRSQDQQSADSLIEHDLPGMGQRRFALKACKISADNPNDTNIILVMQDITGTK